MAFASFKTHIWRKEDLCYISTPFFWDPNSPAMYQSLAWFPFSTTHVCSIFSSGRAHASHPGSCPTCPTERYPTEVIRRPLGGGGRELVGEDSAGGWGWVPLVGRPPGGLGAGLVPFTLHYRVPDSNAAGYPRAMARTAIPSDPRFFSPVIADTCLMWFTSNIFFIFLWFTPLTHQMIWWLVNCLHSPPPHSGPSLTNIFPPPRFSVQLASWHSPWGKCRGLFPVFSPFGPAKLVLHYKQEPANLFNDSSGRSSASILYNPSDGCDHILHFWFRGPLLASVCWPRIWWSHCIVPNGPVHLPSHCVMLSGFSLGQPPLPPPGIGLFLPAN